VTAAAAPARAGLVVRLAALLYEALLVTALVFVVGFVMLPLVSPHASGDALTIPPLFERVALFCVVFAVLAAYFTWSWSEGRQTLAQKSWRLVLARANGAAVDTRTALARYLAGWIGPALAVVVFLFLHPRGLGTHAAWLVAFNFVFALIDPERQFLHDRLAGTRVVKQPRAAER
jgi:uncharacterized RDD family membrane protein YckC